MRTLFFTFTLLSFLHTEPLFVHAEHEQFFQNCPPNTCGSGSGPLDIRFPLSLQPSQPSCGLAALSLTCSGNDTILSLPSIPPLKVTAIDYAHSTLTVLLGSSFGSLSSTCPLRELTSFSFLKASAFTPHNTLGISLVRCLEPAGPSSGMIAGPVQCLSRTGSFVYVAGASESMEVIPKGCMVVATGGEIPYSADHSGDSRNLGMILKSFEANRSVSLKWDVGDISRVCVDCEGKGGRCGFELDKNQSFCQSSNHASMVKIITGTTVSGFLILVIVTLIVVYISRLSVKDKDTRQKVEIFLATYQTTQSTRYTYSDIKKITKQFKQKLGQGGFGTVFKGELPNGIPVAVKMLEKSKGEAGDFINEVTTMGRIHHTNVVSLLGFCSEGKKQALIYEYMPNESLEKFIFNRESRKSDQPAFSMAKLQDIAIGIAQGIEYLHQGCDQRILHFDIKPHNILLDNNFNPKISDFGLAKLCSRDHSIITMTAARGTMGYIAPEMYSRNFGAVSYKSDVYSFGMLLLEMVSGRKSIEPETENRDKIYLPEWMFERLVQGEDLGLANEGKDEEIVKKLVIVALWCIQWSPNDRPTMSKVVQLLIGNLESLQIPPKPFISSSAQDDDDASVVVDIGL